MNTSATGGYLAPTGTAPIDDDVLDDFFQTVVAGITGIAGSLVRPRFQAEPPNLPDFGVSWAAVGVMNRRRDTFAAVAHDPSDEGGDHLQRQEEIDLLVSFYGPACQSNATLLCDGLSIAQNREQLYLAGMGLVNCSDPIRAPELIKGRWLSRFDVSVVIRRQIDRVYPVLNVLSADVEIEAPPAGVTIIVAP